MNKRFRNIWEKLRKFKWDDRSWYSFLLGGGLFMYIYIDALFNYAEYLEKGADPDRIFKGDWYYNQLYSFDTWFGKTATIIILGVLTLIPFILAIRIYRKQRKMKQKKKIPAVERDL